MMEAVTEIVERIARLETKMDAIEETYRDARSDVRKIEDNLETLMRKIDRYESKLGGVFLAATALIAFIKLIGETGWKWLTSLVS